VNIRDEIISEVKQHLGEDASKSGDVLYNGWDTLCPSNDGLYIMGFNPGGDPAKIDESILQSLEKLEDNYCSYEDACWRKSCPNDCRNENHFGQSLHQNRVKQLAKVFDYEIGEVFAANAIFIRSKTQGHLRESLDLFKKCWLIHKRFLSIVKPRIILCLGNKEDMSAFALLREMLAIEPNQVRRCGHVKAFSSAIAVSDRETINSHVIGVRHPSQPWFNPVEELRLFLTQENPDVMAGKRWSEV
jgi:hypothetical protein